MNKFPNPWTSILTFRESDLDFFQKSRKKILENELDDDLKLYFQSLLEAVKQTDINADEVSTLGTVALVNSYSVKKAFVEKELVKVDRRYDRTFFCRYMFYEKSTNNVVSKYFWLGQGIIVPQNVLWLIEDEFDLVPKLVYGKIKSKKLFIAKPSRDITENFILNQSESKDFAFHLKRSLSLVGENLLPYAPFLKKYLYEICENVEKGDLIVIMFSL